MKKILSVILAGMLVFSLAGCNKENGKTDNKAIEETKKENKAENEGKKINIYTETIEGDDIVISADFFYPEDADITVKTDEYYNNCVDMNYESKNIVISPAIMEDTTFDENKEYAKEEEETYKEFKINGYDCYGYEDFSGYWIYVHLEEISEIMDRYLVISTDIIDYSNDDTPKGIAHYEDEDIKKIIESFVYNGEVPAPETEE